MNKRPVAIVIIGVLFILTGLAAGAAHLVGYRVQHPFQYDIVWAELVNLTAILCGIYLLRGKNWARWLAIAWIGFHVVLSIFHALPELAIHTLILLILAYFLFRPAATRYFQTGKT